MSEFRIFAAVAGAVGLFCMIFVPADQWPALLVGQVTLGLVAVGIIGGKK